MPVHRFQSMVESFRLPMPPTPDPQPGSFVLYPMAVTGSMAFCWQCQIYQAAWQEALAVARPSLPERDLLAVWN
jgi:hypothetical protein